MPWYSVSVDVRSAATWRVLGSPDGDDKARRLAMSKMMGAIWRHLREQGLQCSEQPGLTSYGGGDDWVIGVRIGVQADDADAVASAVAGAILAVAPASGPVVRSDAQWEPDANQ